MSQEAVVPKSLELDAQGVYYRELNARLRQLLDQGGYSRVVIRNVCGQRYIGTGLRQPVRIEIEGTPGNDLGAFMDGPSIVVHGNAQDACGNTLNAGEVTPIGAISCQVSGLASSDHACVLVPWCLRIHPPFISGGSLCWTV